MKLKGRRAHDNKVFNDVLFDEGTLKKYKAGMQVIILKEAQAHWQTPKDVI